MKNRDEAEACHFPIVFPCYVPIQIQLAINNNLPRNIIARIFNFTCTGGHGLAQCCLVRSLRTR